MIGTEGKKGKHWKKAAIFFFAVYWLVGNSFDAAAADKGLFLQSYRTEEGKAFIYGASLPDEEKEEAEADRFTANISGQDIPVLEAYTMKEAQEGITFYCLVDVSGSMKDEQLLQAKEVLLAIGEGLLENDNMVIGAIGTEIETTDFLTDKKEIADIAEGLTADKEYTALYDAVIESIDAMTNNKNCRQKKCLVIISDGNDETVIGRTRNEVLKEITDSKIPVYTVAALRSSYTRQQIEYAENLGALARQSSGGKDFAPVVGGYGAEETGQAILEDSRDGLVLQLDISEAEPAWDEALLSIQFETDTNIYSGTLYIYASDLRTAQKEISGGDASEQQETEGQTEEPENQTREEESDPSKKQDIEDPKSFWLALPVYVWGLIAAAILLAIAAVILVVKRKRRIGKNAAECGKTESGVSGEMPDGKENIQEENPVNAQIGKIETVHKPDRAVPGYEVKFVAIGYQGKEFQLFFPEGKVLTLGRNRKADLVLNSEDTHLSSVQCKVRCAQNIMNIWDMDSRNGTFINGVSVSRMGMGAVNSGDAVRMGSYEYRVYIVKKTGK